jgi:hypothetical protein
MAGRADGAARRAEELRAGSLALAVPPDTRRRRVTLLNSPSSACEIH